MYDVNPLGPMMHLKELERRAAAASLRRPQPRVNAALSRLLFAALERFHACFRPSRAKLRWR